MRLVEARQQAGLTQVELAARIGMSQSGVSDFELARRIPSVAVARRIERILGVSPGGIDWPENVAPRRPASGE